jgi:hypothetical protein
MIDVTIALEPFYQTLMSNQALPQGVQLTFHRRPTLLHVGEPLSNHCKINGAFPGSGH